MRQWLRQADPPPDPVRLGREKAVADGCRQCRPPCQSRREEEAVVVVVAVAAEGRVVAAKEECHL